MNISEIIQSILPNFGSEITIEKLTSGTNTVWKVQGSYTLIFREFGTVPLICPEIERENFRLLSSKGIGPKLVYEDRTFRIEEYLEFYNSERKRHGLWITPDQAYFEAIVLLEAA